MKFSGFAVFLTIVLIIYAAINFYILRRGWQALEGTGGNRLLFLYGFLFLVLAYPAGRFLEHMSRNIITDLLLKLGSFYLGLMVYLFFLLLIIDLFRLANHFVHFFPAAMESHPQKSAQFAFLGVTLLVLVIGISAFINALHPRVRTFDLTVAKTANGMENLRIVMASDIHLGTIIHNDRLLQMVNKINNLNPDIILLPGDVVDEDIGPLKDQGMNASLKKLRAPFGVYAVTGNHEYFGGVKSAVNYLEGGNITFLQDSVIRINDSFYLAGRKDLTAQRWGQGRKPLEEILQGIDRSLPVIMMDHQPFHLEQAQQNEVDLQLSGHTHHGQLYPFNYITEKIFEVSWGYKQKGNTHYYVSCGAGTWGPPMRLGNRPEIVVINLNFTENDKAAK
ncbi:MAG: metallophosphoesterase [Calditrichia bacterium]